ncbi:MAG: hypothetical protein EBZ74_02430 [Planctomycetia bacterium]|nr:hypothetical protein [Planctomycetia bacterium]
MVARSVGTPRQGPTTRITTAGRALYARWRCYWPFGSGMLTDLFVHRTTTMLKATGLRSRRTAGSPGTCRAGRPATPAARSSPRPPCRWPARGSAARNPPGRRTGFSLSPGTASACHQERLQPVTRHDRLKPVLRCGPPSENRQDADVSREFSTTRSRARGTCRTGAATAGR